MADNNSLPSRVSFVMETIRERIAAGALPPGAKLPSIRKLAGTLKLSTSTVVEAYGRLLVEGEVLARPGSGYYVANAKAPFVVNDGLPSTERAVDPFWVSRQGLEARAGYLRPGCGWLPSSWLPQDSIRRALRTLSRAEPETLVDYSTPLGLLALRQVIARRNTELGIVTSPDQVILTESGTQAIDLLCRFLVEPGDVVLVDDPCYFNVHALLLAHRCKIVGVPLTPTGPNVEAFAEIASARRPRLYITNSGINNPTGAIVAPSTAHRILAIAEELNITVIEDDVFADFEKSPAPRLASLDGLNRVVAIGSFTKTLSASARCGYIAPKLQWVDGIVNLKIATSFGGGRLAAKIVLNVVNDLSYAKHLQKMRGQLSVAMARVSSQLKDVGIVPWIEPQAGMFVWGQLPAGADAVTVAHAALRQKVVLAPGNVFSISQSAPSFMRFNVSQCSDGRVFDVLSDVLKS